MPVRCRLPAVQVEFIQPCGRLTGKRIELSGLRRVYQLAATSVGVRDGLEALQLSLLSDLKIVRNARGTVADCQAVAARTFWPCRKRNGCSRSLVWAPDSRFDPG